MKTTIISPFSFGYIDALVAKLKEYHSVDLIYIKTHDLKFKYDSLNERLKNLWLKNFSNRNLKREFVAEEIKKVIDKQSQQDVILIIRPDKLEIDLLYWLKTKTYSLRSFYFDGTRSIPEQIELIPIFDQVYSYDKRDVQNYNLKFITNFIPYDVEFQKSGKGVFNISSHDKRSVVLEKIALQLKELSFPYRFIVRKEKPIASDLLEVVQDYLPLEEVRILINESNVLVDIQKEKQQGLSFRVLEALGYNKKLITTNKDIVNYDFHNPDNILVIDSDDPFIPREFLLKEFVPVPEDIKEKYRREFWIKKVFGVSKP